MSWEGVGFPLSARWCMPAHTAHRTPCCSSSVFLHTDVAPLLVLLQAPPSWMRPRRACCSCCPACTPMMVRWHGAGLARGQGLGQRWALARLRAALLPLPMAWPSHSSPAANGGMPTSQEPRALPGCPPCPAAPRSPTPAPSHPALCPAPPRSRERGVELCSTGLFPQPRQRHVGRERQPPHHWLLSALGALGRRLGLAAPGSGGRGCDRRRLGAGGVGQRAGAGGAGAGAGGAGAGASCAGPGAACRGAARPARGLQPPARPRAGGHCSGAGALARRQGRRQRGGGVLGAGAGRAGHVLVWGGKSGAGRGGWGPGAGARPERRTLATAPALWPTHSGAATGAANSGTCRLRRASLCQTCSTPSLPGNTPSVLPLPHSQAVAEKSMADLVHFICTGQANRPRKPRVVADATDMMVRPGCWLPCVGVSFRVGVLPVLRPACGGRSRVAGARPACRLRVLPHSPRWPRLPPACRGALGERGYAAAAGQIQQPPLLNFWFPPSPTHRWGWKRS